MRQEKLVAIWRKIGTRLEKIVTKWRKIDRKVRISCAVIGVLLLLFEGAVLLAPLPQKGLDPSTSTLVFDRNAKLLRAFTSEDDMWRINTKLMEISPALQKFLVYYEDRWFYWHPGFNPFSLARAFFQNIRHSKIVSGGSTLTMQIARMIEPKERTWHHKLLEVFRAIQLEQRYSKKELLQIYFNIAPYGGNIEGVAAASWLYFGKEPTELSYGEAALLAAIPNSPTRLRPDLHPDQAKEARDKVLLRLYRGGILKETAYQEALQEKLPTARIEWPLIAPHFCLDLEQAGERQTRQNGSSQRSRIYSTIDRDLQLFCEKMVTAHVKRLKAEGITNGAVVVIDNQRHEVLAAVGSAEFFNERDQGQVNGYLAPRSPGSTLKPFVYAMGLDRGQIAPGHYLEDVPVVYSGYSPENFDRAYHGAVSAREALIRSLNVPVVNLLARMGGDSLHELLRKAGFSTIREIDDYGLQMVLGGCEVTLLELTALYSALADGGRYLYPRVLRDGVAGKEVRLFSPGAVYIITELLTEVRRPDLPSCWEFTSLPKVAWKTGTSYGYKDAWSIGYNPRYTVGVWVGNFNAKGCPGLIGAEAAAPLLFEIFTDLVKGADREWFTIPSTVKTREVCALSGQLATGCCQERITDYYLTDATKDQPCELHQPVIIDPKTGYRLPPHYASGAIETEEKVYVKWPPRIASWLEKNGFPIERIPSFSPEWQKYLGGGAPVIRSPSSDWVYRIREGIPEEFQKICLEAAASNDVQRLYWFIDGRLVGETAPGRRLFILPAPGQHRVVCQDERGRSAETRLVVEGGHH